MEKLMEFQLEMDEEGLMFENLIRFTMFHKPHEASKSDQFFNHLRTELVCLNQNDTSNNQT